MQSTCIPSWLCRQQSELQMQVHCIGGQRRGCHHSVVGLCSWVFSSLPCLCPFYRSTPNLKWSFLLKHFSSMQQLMIMLRAFLCVEGARHFSAMCPFVRQFMQSPSFQIHYGCVSDGLASYMLGIYHMWMMRRIAWQTTYDQIRYERHSRDVSHGSLKIWGIPYKVGHFCNCC